MKSLFATAACLLSLGAHAAITVNDDDGRPVTLQKPALRVISMAPHVTELLYAAGGAQHIVGAVEYSDFPEAAKKLPRVGSYRLIDMERIVSLKPDLIIVWHNGNSERQIEQLRTLGVPLFQSEPKKLEDIPASVARFGKLMGTAPAADAVAADLRKQLTTLKTRYSGRPTVRTFYQLGSNPLYTLHGAHIVSDAMRLCGGENIFAEMKIIAPIVGIEAVLQEDPEAVIGTGDDKSEGGVAIWKAYPAMTAAKRNNLFRVDGTLVNRSGPRMIAGAAQICDRLEQARQHRPAR